MSLAVAGRSVRYQLAARGCRSLPNRTPAPNVGLSGGGGYAERLKGTLIVGVAGPTASAALTRPLRTMGIDLGAKGIPLRNSHLPTQAPPRRWV